MLKQEILDLLPAKITVPLSADFCRGKAINENGHKCLSRWCFHHFGAIAYEHYCSISHELYKAFRRKDPDYKYINVPHFNDNESFGTLAALYEDFLEQLEYEIDG